MSAPSAHRLVLTINETAAALACSRGKVYSLIRSGELRPVRLGDRYVVPVAEAHRLAGMTAE